LETSVRELLEQIGVKFEEVNENGRKIVYKIVEQFGGLEAVQTELELRRKPAPKQQTPKKPKMTTFQPEDSGAKVKIEILINL